MDNLNHDGNGIKSDSNGNEILLISRSPTKRDIILGLFSVQWAFPESVKEVLFSWKGSFVGKKRKKLWKFIPLYIFWTIWKETNRLGFKGGVLAVQKLKTSFVCNVWDWAKLYIGVEPISLIGFLEWLAST